MSFFDAILLSYDEPIADQLHARLQRVLGMPVKRLHGVEGMRRAYRLTAEVVSAEQYFLADGDFVIDEDFLPGRVAPLDDGISMRVWATRNPLNGLVYGYGGLKVVRRSAVRAMTQAVDVLAALPGQPEFVGRAAGTTRINQTPYHAWKAGFRECAMLSRGSEYGMGSERTRRTLAAWLAGTNGSPALAEVEYAEFGMLGARDGVAFARDAAQAPGMFDQLNNPTWLRDRFRAAYEAEVSVG